MKIAPISRQSRQYTAGVYGYPEMGAADLPPSFAVMIYGVAVLGWWMAEISGVFLRRRLSLRDNADGEEAFTSTFIDGARICSAWR
ncbi:hypothetical protein KCP73_09130 [Salmonella enterica subsp. enterica]|nr:hypothetical protein KCP73_09130 [Salmonella enterica subsp. enterica]